MNAAFDRMEEFIYGNVFEPADSATGRTIGAGLRRTVKAVLNRSAIAAAVVIIAATAVPDDLTVLGESATQNPALEVLASVSPVELRLAFRKRREYLGLSQDRAARFLQVSPSSIEKYEQGSVKFPSEDNMERYMALIELARLYHSEFGRRKYLIKAALEGPSPYYDGKSALEFALETPDGIFKLLGLERRKYA